MTFICGGLLTHTHIHTHRGHKTNMQIIYTQTRTGWKCSWKGTFRCRTLLSCDIVLKVKRFSFTGPLFDKFRDVVKRNDSQAAKGRKVDKWKAVRNSFFVIIFAQPASGIKVIQRQAAGSVIDPPLCDCLRKKKVLYANCLKWWKRTLFF